MSVSPTRAGLRGPATTEPPVVAEATVVARWLRTLRNGRVVDLGSGSGRLTPLVRSAGHPVVSVDAVRRVWLLASRSDEDRPNEFRVQADINQLPFDSGSFVGALAVRVVHRLRDPSRFLSEASRVLAPGGSLLVSHLPRPSLGTLDLDLNHFLDRTTSQRLSFEPPGRVATRFADPPGWLEGRRAFEGRLRSAGFVISDRAGTGFEDLRLLGRLPNRFCGEIAQIAGAIPGAPTVFLTCRAARTPREDPPGIEKLGRP